MATRAGGRTLGQLWRQGWNEIPEVMISCSCASVALLVAGYGVYYREKHFESGKFFRFRHHYIVKRPGDVAEPSNEYLYTIDK